MESSDAVKMTIVLTLITWHHSLLLMMTCFTRIIIVLSFLRNALGLQQTPKSGFNRSCFVCNVFYHAASIRAEVNETALQPYNDGLIETEEFLGQGQLSL